jgi:hypothetical protein
MSNRKRKWSRRRAEIEEERADRDIHNYRDFVGSFGEVIASPDPMAEIDKLRREHPWRQFWRGSFLDLLETVIGTERPDLVERYRDAHGTKPTSPTACDPQAGPGVSVDVGCEPHEAKPAPDAGVPVSRATPTGRIRSLNDTPMEQLRFRDFHRLKVPGCRDKYSSVRGGRLRTSVTSAELEAITSRIEDPRYQDAACRWILRGLSADRAIRKALTDWEIANNAIGA